MTLSSLEGRIQAILDGWPPCPTRFYSLGVAFDWLCGVNRAELRDVVHGGIVLGGRAAITISGAPCHTELRLCPVAVAATGADDLAAAHLFASAALTCAAFLADRTAGRFPGICRCWPLGGPKTCAMVVRPVGSCGYTGATAASALSVTVAERASHFLRTLANAFDLRWSVFRRSGSQALEGEC
ncbi:hypothetical protein MTO96_011567 [Rhipicephalus appendiculatus]